MKKLTFILFLTGLIILPDEMPAQEYGRIEGRVFMPVISKGRRAFRGRIYRNRLSSANKKIEKSNTLKSSFIDIIISAHPVQPDSLPEPIKPVTMIQLNAEFVPRVVAITPGTEVRFINRDRFFHNVFSITPGSRFNIGRKPTGDAVGQVINKLGETKIFCDIHPQMNAVILCLDSPYFARVGPDGKYTLPNLPPGTYKLQVYHPDLPGLQAIVEIRAGQLLTQNFSLSR